MKMLNDVKEKGPGEGTPSGDRSLHTGFLRAFIIQRDSMASALEIVLDSHSAFPLSCLRPKAIV